MPTCSSITELLRPLARLCIALHCSAFPARFGPGAVRVNTRSKLCRASREGLQARRFAPSCQPEEVLCCSSRLPDPFKSAPKPAGRAVCSNRPVPDVGRGGHTPFSDDEIFRETQINRLLVKGASCPSGGPAPISKRRGSQTVLLKKDIEDQIYDVVMATEIVGL